jgi:hypothetical protein
MNATHRASVLQTPAIAPRFVERDFFLRCVHRCLFVPTGPAAAEPPQNTQFLRATQLDVTLVTQQKIQFWPQLTSTRHTLFQTPVIVDHLEP